MRIYTLDQLRSAATPATSPAAGPMTPARYLRLRRGAAGLSRNRLADRLNLLAASAPRHRLPAYAADPSASEALALVDLLETDGSAARSRRTIEAVAACMPIDVDVYFQLRDEPADRHPLVCAGCGWTTHQQGGEEARSWALPGLCSCCAERGDLWNGFDPAASAAA